MKIFEKNHKINFVDANNVLVGFDYEACCCEDFGFFLASTSTASSVEAAYTDADVEDYVFDPQFEKFYGHDYENGGTVVFRLVATGKQDIFLHLFNHHNGYYSHNFSMHIGNECIKEDSL